MNVAGLIERRDGGLFEDVVHCVCHPWQDSIVKPCYIDAAAVEQIDTMLRP